MANPIMSIIMFWTIGHLDAGKTFSSFFIYRLLLPVSKTLLRLRCTVQLIDGKGQGQDGDVIFLPKALRGFCDVLGSHQSQA